MYKIQIYHKVCGNPSWCPSTVEVYTDSKESSDNLIKLIEDSDLTGNWELEDIAKVG
jgi:hypothetical protein